MLLFFFGLFFVALCIIQSGSADTFFFFFLSSFSLRVRRQLHGSTSRTQNQVVLFVNESATAATCLHTCYDVVGSRQAVTTFGELPKCARKVKKVVHHPLLEEQDIHSPRRQVTEENERKNKMKNNFRIQWAKNLT